MGDFSKDKINIKNKYFIFKYNKQTNKLSAITNGNTIPDIKKTIKGKKINIADEILLMTLKKTDWTPNNKIPINMLGGPIKITFKFYEITEKGKLVLKEDSRDLNFLYYTYDYYLKHKIKLSDLKKVALLCFQNKLEKRLLAPKLITQIK
jgi:hypothetical protein